MANVRTGHTKDGRFYYRIRVSNGRDLNGKQISVFKTFYPAAKEGTKKAEKELQAYIAKMEKEVHEGRFYDGNNITYAVFARDVWKPQYAEKNLSESQQDQYWTTLKKNVFPFIGNMKIAKISGANCQDVIDEMEKTESRRGGFLSPSTIRRRYVVMRSVFNHAYKMNVIADNPCNRCTLPKVKQKEELRTFTEDQAVSFLQFLFNGYDYTVKEGCKHTGNTVSKGYSVHVVFPTWQRAYFYIALYGGARRGEMLGLTWNDIDFKNEEISINKAVKRVKNRVIVGTTKTESGNRVISLPSICFDFLKQLYNEERDLCVRSGKQWAGVPLQNFKKNSVFIKTGKTDTGATMDLCTPYHAFKRIIQAYNRLIDNSIKEGKESGNISPEEIQKKEESKLPLLRLHDMRHTSATIQLAEGVDIETVKQRLGHAKASTTIDIYGHALKTHDKEASAKLENALQATKEEQENEKQAKLPEMLTPAEYELIKTYRHASATEKKEINEKIEKQINPLLTGVLS